MTIRKMTEADRRDVLAMMRTFYASDAVLTDGSEEIFTGDIDACLSDSPFLEGFVFCDGTAVRGYAMIAHSFSTEFGRPCVWIEDLYLEEAFRGKGAAGDFFAMLDREYPDAVHRLEAERENERAVRAYRKNGFAELPYLEMIRNRR